MRSDYRILDLADLAAGQWGLFTTAQAKVLGFSTQQLARLSNQGTVERLRHGAYRIGGAPSVPDEQIRAAWLLIEPAATAGERLDAPQPAVVSHRSAARLHRLGDVDADVMEFTTSRRKQSRLGDVRYRVAQLGRERWTLLDGLPATTVLATIEDLAADHLDGGHLAGIVRDAVTTNRADPDAVVSALRPYAHRYGSALGDGSGLLDRLLEEAGVPESTRALGQRISPAPDLATLYNRIAASSASNPDFFAALSAELHAPLSGTGMSQNTGLQEAIARLSSSMVLPDLSDTTRMLGAVALAQSPTARSRQEVLDAMYPSVADAGSTDQDSSSNPLAR